MEFKDLLEARRSIRQFDGTRKVTQEQVDQMVYAAIQAPSWKNSQTARYYAVLSDEMIARVSEALPAFNAKSSAGAALIVTTFVANRAGFNREGVADNEAGNGWGYYDCGLHNANLILAAKDMGLDTLVMGIRDADKLREVLEIPESEMVVAVIAVGYAAAPAEKPKRKNPQDIVKVF